MGHLPQPKLVLELGADLEDLAKIPVRLPEMLAECQQYHMLVVRVQVIRVLRSSKRVSSPLQDPLLTTNDANQFMLVRLLPISRHEAILWSQDNLLESRLASRLGPCRADVSAFQDVTFRRVSTEQRERRSNTEGAALKWRTNMSRVDRLRFIRINARNGMMIGIIISSQKHIGKAS